MMLFIKKLIIKIGFYVVGRAFQSVSHFNKNVKEEIKVWNNGFVIKLRIKGIGIVLQMKKISKGVKLIKNTSDKADLEVELLTIDGFFIKQCCYSCFST